MKFLVTFAILVGLVAASPLIDLRYQPPKDALIKDFQSEPTSTIASIKLSIILTKQSNTATSRISTTQNISTAYIPTASKPFSSSAISVQAKSSRLASLSHSSISILSLSLRSSTFTKSTLLSGLNFTSWSNAPEKTASTTDSNSPTGSIKLFNTTLLPKTGSIAHITSSFIRFSGTAPLTASSNVPTPLSTLISPIILSASPGLSVTFSSTLSSTTRSIIPTISTKSFETTSSSQAAPHSFNSLKTPASQSSNASSWVESFRAPTIPPTAGVNLSTGSRIYWNVSFETSSTRPNSRTNSTISYSYWPTSWAASSKTTHSAISIISMSRTSNGTEPSRISKMILETHKISNARNSSSIFSSPGTSIRTEPSKTAGIISGASTGSNFGTGSNVSSPRASSWTEPSMTAELISEALTSSNALPTPKSSRTITSSSTAHATSFEGAKIVSAPAATTGSSTATSESRIRNAKSSSGPALSSKWSSSPATTVPVSSASITTSVVYTTWMYRVSCPPGVRCPKGGYVTSQTIPLYTTIRPVAGAQTSQETMEPTPSYGSDKGAVIKVAPGSGDETLTKKGGNTYNVTSCPLAITDCPFSKVANKAAINTQTSLNKSLKQTPTSTFSKETITTTITKIYIVTSCPPVVTDCPIGKITSKVITTTYYPKDIHTGASTAPGAGSESAPSQDRASSLHRDHTTAISGAISGTQTAAPRRKKPCSVSTLVKKPSSALALAPPPPDAAPPHVPGPSPPRRPDADPSRIGRNSSSAVNHPVTSDGDVLSSGARAGFSMWLVVGIVAALGL